MDIIIIIVIIIIIIIINLIICFVKLDCIKLVNTVKAIFEQLLLLLLLVFLVIIWDCSLSFFLTFSCSCLLFPSGDTVVTDHVRSIVRECLQEADVQWTMSQETDPNNNYYSEGFRENERFLDERDNLV